MFLTSPLFSQHGIAHGFGRRFGGVSLPPYDSLNVTTNHGDEAKRVAINLSLISQRLGVGDDQLLWVQQMSEDTIVPLKPNDRTETFRQQAADSIVAHLPKGVRQGILRAPRLCIRTADCLPILVVAPRHRWLAVVHVGWQGAKLRLLSKTIDYLHERGVKPEELLLALGPAIGPCCLKLTGKVASAFLQDQDIDNALHQLSSTSLTLDLWQHSRQLAIAAGVNSKNIDILNICTVCGPCWFFSFRREGALSGRQLSYLGFSD